MPVIPYPGQPVQQFNPTMMVPTANALYKGGGAPDVHSQTSSNDGSSGSEKRRGLLFHFKNCLYFRDVNPWSYHSIIFQRATDISQ